ncbi:substrate-binding domain-containing protein [Saccharophagus degradans]|uniref:substrate-binding domain-containing protein n=1 Tax=Saccharophagus degradans TaxID=86304 RepID=UPI001C0928DC|nr:substrate-binding domain-containing protein [Saccharophagus degradans]MBU2986343.1 substrate-binding domain-containing protein [Saccharophagus degradans]WGO98249.1 substrate-binding domain-containing protein [Saccharophagus degradans]
MRIKHLIGMTIFLAGTLFSVQSLADIAIIVHPSNGAALDADEVSRIFLGKSKSFPGGATAVPVNQAEGSIVRTAFDDGIIGKSASQLKSYWSKLVFTGKGTPPQEVSSEDEIKKLVASNPNMIGYIDAANVDSSVKVALTF